MVGEWSGSNEIMARCSGFVPDFRKGHGAFSLQRLLTPASNGGMLRAQNVLLLILDSIFYIIKLIHWLYPCQYARKRPLSNPH